MRIPVVFVTVFVLFISQVSAKTIKVGSTLALSGPFSAVVSEILKGYTLAFEEARSQGKLDVEFVYYDDGFKPAVAAANAERLVKHDGVDLVFGTTGDSSSLYVARVLNLKKVVLFSPCTGMNILYNTKIYPYVFMVRPSCKSEANALLSVMLSKKYKRIGVVYLSRSLCGLDCMKTILKQIRAKGVDVITVGIASSKDIGVAVQKLKSAKVEAVYIALLPDLARELIMAFVKASYFPHLYGGICSKMASVIKLNAFKEINKFGEVYVAFPFPLPSENYKISRSFTDALKKYRGTDEYTYDMFAGYVAAKVLIEVLSRVGEFSSPKELKDKIESVGPIDIGLPEIIHYTPVNHVGFTKVYIYRVTPEGKFIAVK